MNATRKTRGGFAWLVLLACCALVFASASASETGQDQVDPPEQKTATEQDEQVTETPEVVFEEEESENPIPMVLPTEQDCTACHDDDKQLLLKRMTERPHGRSGLVCADCHGAHNVPSDYEIGFAGTDASAVTERCVGCHTAKGEDVNSRFPPMESMLENGCAVCHGADLVEPPYDWLHPVRPAAAGNHACTDCHTPHTKQRPDLAGDEDKLCLESCHYPVKREFERYSNHWGLTRQVRCIDCHQMHGSSKAPIPVFNVETIYTAGGFWNWTETNETCFDCHDEGEIVYGLETGFRDDPSGVNLHAQHVINGMQACINCHDPHGSSNAYLLRSRLYDKQPFEFFELDDTSRRCYVECHAQSHFPEGYQRTEDFL